MRNFKADPMHETTLSELVNHAEAFFDSVEQGETVRVYRNGRPVADIVPIQSKTPAWKNPPSTRITREGLSLSQAIIKDRRKP